MQSRLLLAVFALFLCSTWAAAVARADTKWLSYSAAVRSYSRIAFDTAGNACMLSPGIAVVKFTATGTLVYSAALPNGFSDARLISIDTTGNCYVAGISRMPSSPATPIFVLKYDGTGALLTGFPFVLSGSGTTTTPGAMAVDATGNIYLAGATSDNDFPETNNAQAQFGGGSSDGFALKLAADASHLIYSTYLGGSLGDSVLGIAVDSSGAAYVCGQTYSADFPTVTALQNTPPDGGGINTQGFVAKFSSSGAFVYSTYFGSVGSASAAVAIAVDVAGEAIVTGNAGTGFPVVNPLPSPPPVAGWPLQGAFVSKIGSNGISLVFSTYFGSNLYGGYAVTLDDSGDIFLLGTLLCTEGPCLAQGTPPAQLPFVNAIQESQQELTDAYVSLLFVAELTNDGGTVLFSTILAGPTSSTPSSMAIDNTGTLYLTSWANPPFGSGRTGVQFPMANADSEPYGSGLQPYPGLAGLFFLSRLSPGPGTVLSVPSTLDMTNAPAVTVGQSALLYPALQIGNYGTNDIHISNITTAGDFQQTNNCPIVLPANSPSSICSFTISFSPTAAGARSGTLTINDDAPGSPHTIQLINATALPGPGLTVNQASLAFNPQLVGTTSASQAIQLQATGNGSIAFNHIGITGNFSETNNCGVSITAGSSCTISVTFDPTSIGTQNGVLTISDNASGSPQTVALSGQGINPSLASSGTTSQTIAAGQTAIYTLSASGFSGTVSFACSGIPAATTCSVSPSSGTFSPANVANIQVTVTTTARSTGLSMPATGVRIPTEFRAWSWGFVILFAGGVLLLGNKAYQPRSLAGLACFMIFSGLVLLYGCGGGGATQTSSPPGTPAGTYQLSVIATAGSTTLNTILTLVVQ